MLSKNPNYCDFINWVSNCFPLMAKYSFRLHLGPYFNTDLQLFCCCSAAKSCLTPCEPMNCSSPGFPVLQYLLEFAQTHVH